MARVYRLRARAATRQVLRRSRMIKSAIAMMMTR
jgi:hypothetical protein